MVNVEAICKSAKQASRTLALLSAVKKNTALAALADWLEMHLDEIIRENKLDIKDGIAAGLSDAMVDRLTLTRDRIKGIASDVRGVISLPDPIGEEFEEKILGNGLQVKKQRIPLGVLAVIYESRPNVTVDVAALALKSGNAIILRGGKETIRSNFVLVRGIHESLESTGIDSDCVQFINEANREYVEELLKMYQYVDMLIPRGGAGLHRYCREQSTIPVITGGIGICHLFVDYNADLMRSLDVIRNAKVQRPTVCNSLDTILVHKKIAPIFIRDVVKYLAKDGVSFRLDKHAITLLTEKDQADIRAAEKDDFDREWLSLILGIKVVDGIDEALEHIALHSTGHSDGILTTDTTNAARFTEEVDSAVVYVNSSTRFTDGSQLGLGAEVAISTQRLHARGPMAMRELTTYKWIVSGDYHVRN